MLATPRHASCEVPRHAYTRPDVRSVLTVPSDGRDHAAAGDARPRANTADSGRGERRREDALGSDGAPVEWAPRSIRGDERRGVAVVARGPRVMRRPPRRRTLRRGAGGHDPPKRFSEPQAVLPENAAGCDRSTVISPRRLRSTDRAGLPRGDWRGRRS